MSQIRLGKNFEDSSNRDKQLTSWFASPGPEAEFNQNEISEQCVIRITGEDGPLYA